jgi:hypothetical protein
MSLLRRFREIAFRTECPEDLATIIIEIAVLNTPTGNHNHVDRLCEIVT